MSERVSLILSDEAFLAQVADHFRFVLMAVNVLLISCGRIKQTPMYVPTPVQDNASIPTEKREEMKRNEKKSKAKQSNNGESPTTVI